MSAEDGEGGKRRIDVLSEALQGLVRDYPDQVAAIGFNTTPFSVKDLRTLSPAGSTNLYMALQQASSTAVLVKNVAVLSDGEPTDGREEESIALARKWREDGVRLSVIYCGPPAGPGEHFLRRLAGAGGGGYNQVRVTVHELREGFENLLLGQKDV